MTRMGPGREWIRAGRRLAALMLVGVAAACGSTSDQPIDAQVAIDAPIDAFVCIDGVDDALCGTGRLCVGGTCVTGECRTAGDCTAPERCLPDLTCSSTGTGADGALTVQSGGAAFDAPWTTVSAIDGADLTTGTQPFTSGDEVLLINLQGARGDVASAGHYELFTVASVSGTGVTLDHDPALGYGAGGANTTLAGNRVVLVRIPNYTSVTLAGPLTVVPWSGGGIGLVAFRATGTVTVMSGASIDTTGTGFYGSSGTCNGVAGRPGEARQPGPPSSAQPCVGWDSPDRNPNLGGGGGGLSDCNVYSCTAQPLGAGGGGAGYGTNGGDGTSVGTHQGGLAGQAHGAAELTTIFLGSGGGGGSGGSNGPNSNTSYTGNGGGIVMVWADSIDVGGSIAASGQRGVENNNCSLSTGSGGGGGGAGGSIWLAAPTIAVSGSVTAVGGPGGCHGGGGGGVGRIRLDCTTCPSSGVSPAPYLGGT